MDLGQKFLVLRFGTNLKTNCIEEHIKVLQQSRECWFGKIGVVPSKKAIDATLDAKAPRIILYTKSHAYECSIKEITFDKPKNGYPEYYEKELFERGILPKSYYKITSIQEIDLKDLNSFVVVSSRNRLTDTLHKSMSSYFFAEYPDKTKEVKTQSIHTSRRDIRSKEKLATNECRYRKEGICSLKSCINFGYECDRPNMCVKQKR